MLLSFNTLTALAILACLLSFNATGNNANDNATKIDVDSNSKNNVISEAIGEMNTSKVNCRVTEPQPLTVSDLNDSITDQHFTLLGKAKFSVLFWDIYESSLLTSDGQPPFNNVCQYSLFEIHYLRDISKKELLDNTVSQWRHLSLNESEYLAFLPLLDNIWLDINAGDRLSMLNQQGKTLFYLNHKNIGEIQSLTFAEIFLGIWLDKNTSEPKLRQQLLGDSI